MKLHKLYSDDPVEQINNMLADITLGLDELRGMLHEIESDLNELQNRFNELWNKQEDTNAQK